MQSTQELWELRVANLTRKNLGLEIWVDREDYHIGRGLGAHGDHASGLLDHSHRATRLAQ